MVRILQQGAGIVHKKGFDRTGIKEILDAAGVPKGSFYHYFRSKEDFGLHLVDFFTGSILARMEDPLSDSSLPPLGRLRKFFEDFRAVFEAEGFEGGCPVGNFSLETDGLSIEFKEKLAGVFLAMREHVERCLSEARRSGDVQHSLDVREIADFIINSWEGAIIRSKVTGDAAPLHIFENVVFGRLLK